MIKKIFFLLSLCFLLCVSDAAVAYHWDTVWRPDVCLLLVIFVTLSMGFKHGFFCAVVAGVMRDSLSFQTFGLSIAAYAACVYFTDFIKDKLYLQQSFISRLGMVAAATFASVFIQTLFVARQQPLDAAHVARVVFLPQLVMNMVLSEFFFNLFRRCASRFFA